MQEIVVPSTWRERLEALAGRRSQRWLLAGLVGVVVAVAVAMWARGAPATVAPPAAYPTDAQGIAPGGPVGGPSAATTSETGAVASAAADTILVHVAGAVRRPGLYEMPPDARVADAIEAAKGPAPKADLDYLNLAQPVTDGAKVDVPVRGQGAPAAPVPGASPSTTAPAIDLNVADQVALETIPGVGPVTATAILEYRNEIGSFTSVDELLDVSGIGPATLEEIRPHVTL